MGKTVLDDEIIDTIIEEIKTQREKNNIVNLVLRNDVFALLESQECTVLYYPLEDAIEGFRVRKYVQGEYEEFVYINTAKPEDIQVFTAAHELGHLINIDQIVCEKLGISEAGKKIREDIIDRFAAELLMERGSFVKMFNAKVCNYASNQGLISSEHMIMVIVYLMDFFMVPYDAVVRRLCETKRINEQVRDYLMNRNNISMSLVEKAIEDGKYKRLKPTGIKSFGELPWFLEQLGKRGEINECRLKKIMGVFDIKEFEEIDKHPVENIQLEKDTDND